MRRLARRLFTLCSAVSLLLCVAVCVLWVRSYARADEGYWRRDDLTAGTAETRKVWLRSARGVAWGLIYRESTPLGPGDREYYLDLEVNPFENRWDVTPWPDQTSVPRGKGWWSRRGFRFDRDRYRLFDTTAVELEVGMPYWLLAAVTGGFPAAWLWDRRRRRRRARPGFCPTCGYDLRASPGRCPECGAAARGA